MRYYMQVHSWRRYREELNSLLWSRYKWLLLRLDKRGFAFFFNLRSLLRSSSTRLSWLESEFVVRDKELAGFNYRVQHKERCELYQHGVVKRAELLADQYFLDEIGFKDGDAFLDCGANVGDLKIWFHLKNIAVKYVGFEPSPIEFGCLQQNVEGGELHNVGLWNESGKMDFFLSSRTADSSLIEPANFDNRIIVSVERLEGYVDTTVKALKLEAEGAEPEILEGLGDKLSLIEFITADLGFERGVDSESTLVPVTNYLLDRGFELLRVSHGRVCALFRNKAFTK